MTANNAIEKIRVLLGVQEEKVAMATDVLVDGTQVEVEGEFEVGKPLFVVTAEGNMPAPAGIHQTASNLLVTVDDAGVITQIEEVAAETAEEVEEEVKVEMEDETKEEETMTDEEIKVELEEEMIIKIVEALKPHFEEIKEIKEKVIEMEGKFQKFSKEPAAKPIKKAEAFNANKMSAVERIAQIRKSK